MGLALGYTPEERAANPAFAEQVEPLLEALRKEWDFAKRCAIRKQMDAALREVDRAPFKPPQGGHFDAHFRIVGYTMSAPISDGKRLYVWTGTGVAACFDFEGRRQWMTTIIKGELSYTSAPALSDGVLAVFQGHLMGLDA